MYYVSVIDNFDMDVFGNVSKDKEIIIFNNLNDVSDNIYKKIKEFKPENEERVAIYIHGKKTLDAIKFNKDFNIETNKKLINLFTKNDSVNMSVLYECHEIYIDEEGQEIDEISMDYMCDIIIENEKSYTESIL